MKGRGVTALLCLALLLLSGCGGGQRERTGASVSAKAPSSAPVEPVEPVASVSAEPEQEPEPEPEIPEIPQYHSEKDQDGDGVDDQIDILESARAYMATCPKYKSIYYETGYPNDDHGVCTDVVANGMRGAGYDLMELVQADIRETPEDYDIDVPDPKIDFRRVVNLKVYFDHTAQSLTTSLKEPEEWQGGDIVVFERPNHIGVVSDRRDPKGLPYVFHHVGKRQKKAADYEEDMLPKWRKKIVGHYRIS